MVAVPKMATVPTDLVNSRGALCASVPAKLLGGVLREAALPMLERFTWGHQFGSVRGGGTDIASFCVRSVFEYGNQTCTAVGVVFADLKAAIFTVLTEEMVGRFLTATFRQHALR